MVSALRSIGQQYWWIFLVQGIVSIIFGILLLFWPHETLTVMVMLFGWMILFGGIVSLVAAAAVTDQPQMWGWRIGVSLVGILGGIIILKWPLHTLVWVTLLIGIAALTLGVLETIGTIVTFRAVPHAWLHFLGGALTILFGAFLLVWPEIALMTLIYLSGGYAILYGIIACVAAFFIRGAPHDTAQSSPAFE